MYPVVAVGIFKYFVEYPNNKGAANAVSNTWNFLWVLVSPLSFPFNFFKSKIMKFYKPVIEMFKQ